MAFDLKAGRKISKYTLINRIGEGGFGQVWLARESRNAKRKVAIKICCGAKDDETLSKAKDRIRYEAGVLSELSRVAISYVPHFYEVGEIDGNPYYVMENLVEMMGSGYRGLPIYEESVGDKSIVDFVKAFLSAVKAIHDAGWVHCDLKPSNLMQRGDDATPVLVDFGSAHVVEKDVRVSSDKTISIMVDGSRILPFTPGYADPVEELHTVHGDIYAIGQVIRDLFREDVPLIWGKIINKCLSRNLDYRYPDVDAVLEDVAKIAEIGREEMRKRISSDLLSEIELQSCLTDESPIEMNWSGLTESLAEKQNNPTADVVFADHEVFVDFKDLDGRNIEITGRVKLRHERFIVIKGPGVFKVNMSAEVSKDFPQDAVVFLWNNATLINTCRTRLEDGHIRYMVGGSCYLNFANLKQSPDADSEYVHQSDVGYSFVRSHGPQKVMDLIRKLNDRTCGFIDRMVCTTDFGEMSNYPCSGNKISRYLFERGIVDREMGVFTEIAADGRKRLEKTLRKRSEGDAELFERFVTKNILKDL